MLDIKDIRQQPDKYRRGIEKKGFLAADLDSLLAIDERRRQMQTEVDSLRARRSALGRDDLEQARELKLQLEKLEGELSTTDRQFTDIMLTLPNLPAVDVPVGTGESANQVIRTVGEPPAIENPTDHLTIATKYDLVDIERASKVSGSRFNYLKNQAVILEFALIRYALDIAIKHGFSPLLTPVLVNQATVYGTGYLPAGEDEVYKTTDDLYLIGTSELSLVAYHADEIFPADQLPRRYVGFSSCFRREAGSYGKDTRGIFRQHQFDKVEMVSFVRPEESESELESILAIEEEIVSGLGLAYQIVQIGTGDLGIQAAKKYDIETWFPAEAKYRETHSCSNTTDFQTRRLAIRYRAQEGRNEFVHTLNGTALAVGRMLAAILENGQQSDGTVTLPAVLHAYAGFENIS